MLIKEKEELKEPQNNDRLKLIEIKKELTHLTSCFWTHETNLQAQRLLDTYFNEGK